MNIKRHRIVWEVLLSTAGLVLVGTCPSVGHTGTVFYDDFSDGDAEDGMPVSWSVSPEYAGTSFSVFDDPIEGPSLEVAGTGFAAIMTPDVVVTDASIRAQVRLAEGDLVGIGLGYQEFGEISGVQCGIYRDGRIEFGITKRVVLSTWFRASTNMRPASQEIVLQLDSFGNELKFWAWPAGESIPALPFATIINEDYAPGHIAAGEAFGDPLYIRAVTFVTFTLPTRTSPNRRHWPSAHYSRSARLLSHADVWANNGGGVIFELSSCPAGSPHWRGLHFLVAKEPVTAHPAGILQSNALDKITDDVHRLIIAADFMHGHDAGVP